MEKIQGIVRSATDPKEFNGVLQIGFTMKENPEKWVNITGEEEDLKSIRKEIISKGNEIAFDLDNAKVTNLKLVKAASKDEGKPDHGDMVDFEQLLNSAHENGLDDIKTELLTIDTEKKYALFKCVVHGTRGFYCAHGDATTENVTGDISKHWIRMAETRSIVRALRWYTNNATCSEEEKE